MNSSHFNDYRQNRQKIVYLHCLLMTGWLMCLCVYACDQLFLVVESFVLFIGLSFVSFCWYKIVLVVDGIRVLILVIFILALVCIREKISTNNRFIEYMKPESIVPLC